MTTSRKIKQDSEIRQTLCEVHLREMERFVAKNYIVSKARDVSYKKWLTFLDSWSDFIVSAMYLIPSIALFTSGFLVSGEWKLTAVGPGFPEISEISMSSVKIRFSCLSLDGRFIVEKNITFGTVSIKI